MIKQLLTNWKTTSAGLTMIIGSVVHLVFSVKAHSGDETTWTVSLTAILGGLGLLFAGDANVSSTASTTNAAAINKINALGSDPGQPPIKPTP
jgi:hypothetical protein